MKESISISHNPIGCRCLYLWQGMSCFSGRLSQKVIHRKTYDGKKISKSMVTFSKTFLEDENNGK